MTTDANEIALPKLLRQIPRKCYKVILPRAIAYLVADYFMLTVAVLGIVYLRSWCMGIPLSLFLGTVLSGLFILGHDAGHRSFCHSPKWNNFVGHLTTTLALWPFHVWRLSHNTHHRHTHHVHREIAWRPAPLHVFRRLPAVHRSIYHFTRTCLFFLGSAIFTAVQTRTYLKDSTLDPKVRRQVIFSISLTLLIAVSTMFLSTWAAGFYGFVTLFLLPQVVFHMWLSLFTLLHHTTPDVLFLAQDNWTKERAAVMCTIHIEYPGWVDLLNHDISWHIPHHVCPAIPHYHLKEAHRALERNYAHLLTIRRFSLTYLVDVLRRCYLIQGYAPGQQEWISKACASQLDESSNVSRQHKADLTSKQT